MICEKGSCFLVGTDADNDVLLLLLLLLLLKKKKKKEAALHEVLRVADSEVRSSLTASDPTPCKLVGPALVGGPWARLEAEEEAV